MDKETKAALKLAALRFNTAPHVEKIVDALRTRHILSPNELGQFGIEVAQEWIKTEAPHEWLLYDPHNKTAGKVFYFDGMCLCHIIRKITWEVIFIMGKELKTALKRMGVTPTKDGPRWELWFILDYASSSWLRAHWHKIRLEKHEQTGIDLPKGDAYPIEQFNIPELVKRIIEEPLFAQSQDIYEQLDPIADTIAETIDRIDPTLKYTLSKDMSDIERKIRFLLVAFNLFEAIENGLCLEFAQSKFARSVSSTPDQLCSALRILTEQKVKALAN